MKTRCILVAHVGILFCLGEPLLAQKAAETTTTVSTTTAISSDPFTFLWGQVTQTSGDEQTVYTLRTTQPAASKLVGQKLRLGLNRSSPTGTSTCQLTINTGQHKTVVQMATVLGDIFHRFLTTQAAPGQEFGKIGDVRYGGEIRFVADSPDSLSYQVTSPEGPAEGSGHFDRMDVQTFVAILAGKPTA